MWETIRQKIYEAIIDERFGIGALIIVTIMILIIFFIMVIKLINDIRYGKVKNKNLKFIKMVEKSGVENIEDLLEKTIKKLERLNQLNCEMNERVRKIERNLCQSIQKVAIIRYNAFRDTGSDQSFSIALLDYYNDGVIISSIYSRDGGLTFSKPVIGGKSTYTFSAEEQQVLNQAMSIKYEKIESINIEDLSVRTER